VGILGFKLKVAFYRQSSFSPGVRDLDMTADAQYAALLSRVNNINLVFVDPSFIHHNPRTHIYHCKQVFKCHGTTNTCPAFILEPTAIGYIIFREFFVIGLWFK
jgi:hypothetical protein